MKRSYQRLTALLDAMASVSDGVRPRDAHGRPGGLIEFPDSDARSVVIIGDLHANTGNLKRILKDGHHYRRIKENRTILLLLGDAFHESRTQRLAEMETSMRMLDILIILLSRHPENVFYLRGNHDSFAAEFTKGGVAQGQLFHRHIVRRRGAEYAELVNRFFDALPYVVKHPRFLALHAGPPLTPTTRDAVVNIRDDAALQHALVWNRINDMKLPTRDSLYVNSDLDNFRVSLGVPKTMPIIVGHNPMRHRGTESLWIDLADCHDHVIFTSDGVPRAPYIYFGDSPRFETRWV